jgi:hypothetical protein
MLMRISLIVAIIAGIAAGALNFVKVKEKIETIEAQREKERTDKETAQKDARETHVELKKTTDQLNQTKTLLAATTQERDDALKNLDTATKLSAKLKDDLDKRTKELQDSQDQLEAYHRTELKPEEIMAIKKTYKGLEDQIAEDKVVIAGLTKQVRNLKNELAIYKEENYQVKLPSELKGKVMVVDPKWGFVVLNIGEDQGVLDQGELLINRNSRLVAKVKVRSVLKDRCIANIMPGWQLGDVLEGDLAIPAYPSS